MIQTNPQTERLLGVIVLLLLVVGCLIVLRPFFAPIVWAAVLATSTWPVYVWLRDRCCRGDPTLGASLMTALLTAALLIPVAIVGATLAENVSGFFALVQNFLRQPAGALPSWLTGLSLVGPLLEKSWQAIASGRAELTDLLAPYLGTIRKWLMAITTRIGSGILELLLSLFTVFFLYRDGETAARKIRALGQTVAGEHGGQLIQVAMDTMKGVVYGIIGTGLAQGLLAALGTWIAGVPSPVFLGLLTFFLSLVPVGPPLVWGSSAFWLFHTGHMEWAVFMLIWGFAVISSVDNIIKPFLISWGSRLPLILVLFGVLGGVLAFGFLGLFVGPSLLAIGFTMLKEWTPRQQPG